MKRALAKLTLTAIVTCAAPVTHAVDVWDLATTRDDTPNTTQNVLWHTAPAQVHDLEAQAAADQDWFRIYPRARRSYEVQVVNVTADTQAYNGVRRYLFDGTTLLQTSVALDIDGYTQTLRWIEPQVASPQFVTIKSLFIVALPASQYTIQLRESTLYCARYNNTGSQVSVLLIQRTDPDNFRSCGYEVRYNNAAGTEVGSSVGNLAPDTLNVANTMSVIATQGINGVGGTSGSAYIAHTCGFGGINAKMVALDPATGFSFDTPCMTRPTN